MNNDILHATVRYGVTRNMGNYESLRLDYEVTKTLLFNDNPAEELHRLREQLRSEVAAAIKQEIEFIHGAGKPQRRD